MKTPCWVKFLMLASGPGFAVTIVVGLPLRLVIRLAIVTPWSASCFAVSSSRMSRHTWTCRMMSTAEALDVPLELCLTSIGRAPRANASAGHADDRSAWVV